MLSKLVFIVILFTVIITTINSLDANVCGPNETMGYRNMRYGTTTFTKAEGGIGAASSKGNFAVICKT